MTNQAPTLSLPIAAPDVDDYLRVERSSSGRMIPIRTKAGSLVASDGSSNRTLDQVAARTFGAIAAAGSVPGSTVVATEYGQGDFHATRLDLTAFVVGTSGDNANLAFGAKIYTFPAGDIAVHDATLSGGLTAAISVTTDTPEVGIGTVVATGAAATLSTGTWENIMDGGATLAGIGDGVSVAPDVAGTRFHKRALSTVKPFIKVTGGLAHDVFLNVADGWADVTAAGAVTFTGTIWLYWSKVS